MSFLFISASFDILAALSISCIFSSVFQASENSPVQTFPEQLSNSFIPIKFKVWETFPSNYEYFNCQSSRLLFLLENFKIIKMKTLVLVVGSNMEIKKMHFFEFVYDRVA